MSDLTPYLCVADARTAIDWYQRVLGATASHRPLVMSDGRIGHCELRVGDTLMMLADAFPEVDVEPPDPARGTPVSLHLRVDDCDAVIAAAVAAGARVDRGPESTDHGRTATVHDPFGHRWLIHAAAAQVPIDTHERAPQAEFQSVLDGWAAAIVANDPDRIAAFAEQDWVIVGPEGGPGGLDRFLELVASGDLTHSAMAFDILDVRVFGEAAVVLAHGTNRGTWRGEPFAADEWVTDVFVRRGNSWRCSMSALTPNYAAASLATPAPAEAR